MPPLIEVPIGLPAYDLGFLDSFLPNAVLRLPWEEMEVFKVRDMLKKMTEGFSAQGWVESYSVERNGCMYHGSDGKKCAIGHLIPSEHYREDMEGLPASQLQILFPQTKAYLESVPVQLLTLCQRVHDSHKASRKSLKYRWRYFLNHLEPHLGKMDFC